MKKRNKFALSHYKLLTCDMGELIPVSWYEALPGDTIQHQTSAFVRVAPTLAPIMTPCHVEFRSFSVPIRLLWDNGPDDCWENFITGGPDGMDTATPPYYTIASGTTVPIGSLADYLGIPSGESFGSAVNVSALPFRAYYKIWDEYFRDQDLQQENDTGNAIEGGLVSGSVNDLSLLKVNWKKDYFTVARPWEQKGPAVTVPVNLTSSGGDPLITAQTTLSGGSITGAGIPVFTGVSGNPSPDWINVSDQGYALGTQDNEKASWFNPALTLNNPAAQTTITWNGGPETTGSITVDDIREAFALQRFEEARALFGSRYVEYLRYLGVRSSDARLQRPEYLGGGSQVIQWSEVVQTAPGDDPVGTLRGHGVSGGRTRRWRRFFEEHCIVMTVAWIRPISLYMQSLPRAWSRTIKEDYWQKELEHIGEQEVFNKELYAVGATPDGVFGYMDRYDEYRSIQNSICGDFRDTLRYWHLGREFTSQPVLNSDFVSCNPSKRIFAEQTADEFYCMFLHSVQARRLVSRKGRPGGL